MRDPLSPELNLTAPLNVEPLKVATTLSSMLRFTSPDDPPPARPVPAFTAVMSPTFPVTVIDPFDPVVKDIPLPAMRYDVPSESRVREPERLLTTSVFVTLSKVKLELPPKAPTSLNCMCVFDPPGIEEAVSVEPR